MINMTSDERRALVELIQRLEAQPAKTAFSADQNCKQYSDMSLCPNAETLQRLTDEYAGLDSLVRFRLTGTTRVYGARVRNEFHFMWWDRDHEVWPSKPR